MIKEYDNMNEKKIAITLQENSITKLIKKIKILKYEKNFNGYFECRLDYITNINDMEKDKYISILEELTPYKDIIIFTLRSENEGGYFKETKKYDEYLALCIDILSPKYMDIEYNLSNKKENLIRKAHTKGVRVIGSIHILDNPKKKEFLFDKLFSMHSIGFDILKIASIYNSIDDINTMLSLPKELSSHGKIKDIILISMGESGKITRIYNKYAPFMFSSYDNKKSIGQIFYRDMEKYFLSIEKYRDIEKKNLYIIGFMGTGKTHFGRKLSKKLKIPFFDMDYLLEDIFKMSIDSYFKMYGEASFRELETKLIMLLSKVGPSVISCGGGIIKNKKNIDIMKKSGIIIHLDASLYKIKRNLINSYKRPLIRDFFEKGEDTTLKKLYIERKDLYKKYSDIKVNVNKKYNNKLSNIALLYEENSKDFI